MESERETWTGGISEQLISSQIMVVHCKCFPIFEKNTLKISKKPKLDS